MIHSCFFHRSTKEYANCSIVETKGKYFTQPYAWTFPKHSPYLEAFNFYISEVIEKGQWNAIIKKYEAPPQVCPDMSGQPIEFANCFTAFLALVSGLLLGLLLLLFENIFKPFEHFFRKNGWMASKKVYAQSMDRAQLEWTVIQQSKTITRMKSIIEMNQKMRKRARHQKILYDKQIENLMN